MCISLLAFTHQRGLLHHKFSYNEYNLWHFTLFLFLTLFSFFLIREVTPNLIVPLTCMKWVNWQSPCLSWKYNLLLKYSLYIEVNKLFFCVILWFVMHKDEFIWAFKYQIITKQIYISLCLEITQAYTRQKKPSNLQRSLRIQT